MFDLRPIFRPHQTCQGVRWLSNHLKQQFSHQNNLTGKFPLGRCKVPCVLRLCDRQTGTSLAPIHVAIVKQTTGPNTAAFTNENFNTLMCCGAMLSKKKSVLRLRKSEKNNATVSLVFTARFTPQSAWDIFVIKLGRHACLDKAIWHAVWQAPERGYGPGWPEVPSPWLASLARPADGCFNLNALWNLSPRVMQSVINKELHVILGKFGINSPRLFAKHSNCPHFVWAILSCIENKLDLYIPYCPQKHAVTSTDTRGCPK